MTPRGIVVVLRPLKRQVYEPLEPLQVKDLPALVALGPAVTLIDVKSDVEYVNVHCSPDGCVTAEARERSTETVPPARAVPEDRDKTTCAEVAETERVNRVNKSNDLVTQVRRIFITVGFAS